MTSPSTVAFDENAPWELSSRVSLRREDFGALAYHHDTRRLVFLKSPELVTLVEHLGEFASASAALHEYVKVSSHANYVRALASLATSEIIRGR